MDVTRTEAQEALDDIGSTNARTRRRLFAKGPDAVYALWGAIWIAAFVLQQFVPEVIHRFGDARVPTATLIWSPAIVIGVIGTLLIVKRRVPVTGAYDRKVGALWGLAFGYFYLWVFLLMPLVGIDAMYSANGVKLLTAAVSTVPMFAYVLMGLWGYGRYMIWLGLGVTAATVIGLMALPGFFYLWMATIGGGALFMTGVLLRSSWRRP